MEIVENDIKGVFEIILEPTIDNRGYFIRTYDEKIFYQYGIKNNWVQENYSHNKIKYTLRGLHFLLPPYMDGKLIRCIRGKVLDVFVDLRKNSSTMGRWGSKILDEEKICLLYIPKGFAHGFLTLEDNTDILYKHDSYYKKEYDSGIIWNDESLNINWGCNKPILSEKDKILMTYNDFLTNYGGL